MLSIRNCGGGGLNKLSFNLLQEDGLRKEVLN